MTNTHAVRRRLTESLHRPFIQTMLAREMPYDVVVEALMLVDGNEQAVLDALDFIGVWGGIAIGTLDSTRLLNHLRTSGRQL